MNWDEFNKAAAAFCAWREARGETATLHDSLRCIVHVIDNRAKLWKRSWASIVYQFEQFSSITAPGDPQIKAGLVPTPNDPQFKDCCDIANLIYGGGDFDLTNGATHYFNPGIVLPSWAAGMVKVASIGHHDFYKG
jgi:N-acetylmuramoyl-L-alanine amidase